MQLDPCNAFDLFGFSLSEEKCVLLGAGLKCPYLPRLLTGMMLSRQQFLGSPRGEILQGSPLGFWGFVINFHILEITAAPFCQYLQN